MGGWSGEGDTGSVSWIKDRKTLSTGYIYIYVCSCGYCKVEYK